nr:hypothetical protein [uncultured Desulfobacter sp.]
MKKTRNILIDSGVSLAVISAFLYCVSTAYYRGFLHSLNLEPNILDRNFQHILYNGFLISFSPALGTLLAYFLYRIFYSHVIIPGINDYLRKNIQRKRKFIKIKFFLYGKRQDSEIEKKEKKHSIFVGYIFFISILVIFSLVFFEKKGKTKATDFVKKIEMQSFTKNDYVTVTINNNPHKLVFITCGARSCAGFDNKKKEIVYFNPTDITYGFPLQK